MDVEASNEGFFRSDIDTIQMELSICKQLVMVFMIMDVLQINHIFGVTDSPRL